MLEPTTLPEPSRLARFRARFGQRSAGLFLALALEGLIVLALFTMAPWTPKEDRPSLAIFGLTPDEAPAEAEQEESAAPAPAAEPAPTDPAAPEPPPTEAEDVPTDPQQPVTAPPAIPSWIPMTRDQMAAANIATSQGPPTPAPPSRSRPVYGPVDTGRGANMSGDSERVGTAPGGEPLYAAAWYRRPYPDELRGYLSTASGPGWALIACRTVPQFRVEDCVALDESPRGSNIARAVLAAAWQFRVRPPQVGGELKVGEWVRIRIDYGIEDR